MKPRHRFGGYQAHHIEARKFPNDMIGTCGHESRESFRIMLLLGFHATQQTAIQQDLVSLSSDGNPIDLN